MDTSPDRTAERILIHAPFGRDGALICRVLQDAGMGAVACPTVENLCAAAAEGAGAVLIAEEALRPQNVNVLQGMLRQQPAWSDLPLFLMTRPGEAQSSVPQRMQFLDSLGNVTLLERPLRTETMISGFRMALRARRHQYEIRDHLERERQAAEERDQLLAREREARRTAELLNQVGPLLTAELDPQELAEKVTDLATQLTGAQIGALFHNLRHPESGTYKLYAFSGAPQAELMDCSLTRDTELFGETLSGNAVVRSADLTQETRYAKLRCVSRLDGLLSMRSYLAAPLLSHSGDVLGGLFFGSAEAGVFTQQHAQLAEGIAAQAAIALDNARLFTQLQQAKEALERSNAELRRANEDLNQFAYSASHDLKEPLRMVTVYSQLLQRRHGSALDQEGAEYLSYAIQGAKRMELLIQDLLTYTQAISRDAEGASAVSGADVFRQATGNLKQMIEEAQVKIEAGPLPVLQVKEVHLLQLFQNLIANAVKYRSEARPHIQVTAEQHDGMWKLCLQDNGIGIDPRYAEQVFGLFKRLHGPESGYEGTGLGLAICQKIVERYGGRIWVRSDGPGTGCTFCFTLPGAAGGAV
jgi:signal transduction histidine kinase